MATVTARWRRARALRGATALALGWALGGCPADPAFVGTVDADATLEPDADTGVDTASDIATAPDTADGADTGDADVGPCIPDCAAAFAAGTCGDDGCGGTCACPSASACVDGACACVSDCLVEVDVARPASAALRRDGRVVVALLRSPTVGRSDLVLATAGDDGRFTRTSVHDDAGPAVDLRLALEPGDRPVVLVETIWGDPAAHETDLRAYALDDALGFTSAPVLAGAVRGTRPTLRATRGGVLHALVIDWPDLLLHVVKHVPGEVAPWIQTLVSDDPLGVYQAAKAELGPSAMTLDAVDQPVYVVRCCGPGESADLVFGDRSLGGWRYLTIATMLNTAGTAGGEMALALDGGGRAHVVYQSTKEGVGHLEHLAWTGAEWKLRTIASADPPEAPIGQLIALEADATGRLHLAAAEGGRLVHRAFDGSWEHGGTLSEVVLDDRGEGSAQVVIDAADRPHVLVIDADARAWWWTPPPLRQGRSR